MTPTFRSVSKLNIAAYTYIRVASKGLICLLAYIKRDCTTVLPPHELYLTNIIDIAKFLHYVYNHIIAGYIVQNIFRDTRYF